MPALPVLLCIAAIAGGCGLPQLPLLDPPELAEITALPATVRFTHDPRNSDESFAGYELYYKFYDPDTTVTGGVQAEFEADRDAIEGAAPGNAVTTARSRGFYRVTPGGTENDQPPTIRVAPALRETPFEVTISFPDSGTPGAETVATWDGFSQLLLRDPNAPRTTPEELGFSADDLEPGVHGDLPADPEGGTLQTALMIVSYGTDFITGTFAPIYSSGIVTDQLMEVIYQ